MAVPARYDSRGLGSNCFDAASHIPYAFVVRLENEIHIVHIAY